MPATFYDGTNWQQSSEPLTIVQVHEADIWPVADNSDSGTKDEIEDGLHPIVAIGGRSAADGRPLNLTGVVVTCLEGLVEAEDLVQVNIADGAIVRQYVANVLTYDGSNPLTFETAPVPGQPVYVDDSSALAAGVTVSMSPFNETGTLKNPLAGYLWYCQDEYADNTVGGPNADSTFDTSLADELVEQEYCVLLVSAARELS